MMKINLKKYILSKDRSDVYICDKALMMMMNLILYIPWLSSLLSVCELNLELTHLNDLLTLFIFSLNFQKVFKKRNTEQILLELGIRYTFWIAKISQSLSVALLLLRVQEKSRMRCYIFWPAKIKVEHGDLSPVQVESYVKLKKSKFSLCLIWMDVMYRSSFSSSLDPLWLHDYKSTRRSVLPSTHPIPSTSPLVRKPRLRLL